MASTVERLARMGFGKDGSCWERTGLASTEVRNGKIVYGNVSHGKPRQDLIGNGSERYDLV